MWEHEDSSQRPTAWSRSSSGRPFRGVGQPSGRHCSTMVEVAPSSWRAARLGDSARSYGTAASRHSLPPTWPRGTPRRCVGHFGLSECQNGPGRGAPRRGNGRPAGRGRWPEQPGGFGQALRPLPPESGTRVSDREILFLWTTAEVGRTWRVGGRCWRPSLARCGLFGPRRSRSAPATTPVGRRRASGSASASPVAPLRRASARASLRRARDGLGVSDAVPNPRLVVMGVLASLPGRDREACREPGAPCSQGVARGPVRVRRCCPGRRRRPR